MKLFKTDEDIANLAFDVFNETGLAQLGISLKVMSVNKSREILKISKANATTEFLTNSDDIICLYIFQSVFDKLTDEQKIILLEGIFTRVFFDTEKDKLIINSDQYYDVFSMGKKYGNHYVETLETAYLIKESVEEELNKNKEKKVKK